MSAKKPAIGYKFSASKVKTSSHSQKVPANIILGTQRNFTGLCHIWVIQSNFRRKFKDDGILKHWKQKCKQMFKLLHLSLYKPLDPLNWHFCLALFDSGIGSKYLGEFSDLNLIWSLSGISLMTIMITCEL